MIIDGQKFREMFNGGEQTKCVRLIPFFTWYFHRTFFKFLFFISAAANVYRLVARLLYVWSAIVCSSWPRRCLFKQYVSVSEAGRISIY